MDIYRKHLSSLTILFSLFYGLIFCGKVNAALVVPAEFTWPDGIIPFVFDDQFPAEAEEVFYRAISEYESKTAVRFVLRDDSNADLFPNYKLIFFDENAISSRAGGIGVVEGESIMVLSPQVLDPPSSVDYGLKTIIHELGHVVGLYHEPSRLDMWDYFEIDWDLVIDQDCPDSGEKNNIGIPIGGFDYFSVMNNKPPACSINELGGPSISYVTPTDPEVSLRDVELRDNLGHQLSPGDIEGIDYLYPPDTSAAGSIHYWLFLCLGCFGVCFRNRSNR